MHTTDTADRGEATRNLRAATSDPFCGLDDFAKRVDAALGELVARVDDIHDGIAGPLARPDTQGALCLLGNDLAAVRDAMRDLFAQRSADIDSRRKDWAWRELGEVFRGDLIFVESVNQWDRVVEVVEPVTLLVRIETTAGFVVRGKSSDMVKIAGSAMADGLADGGF